MFSYSRFGNRRMSLFHFLTDAGHRFLPSHSAKDLDHDTPHTTPLPFLKMPTFLCEWTMYPGTKMDCMTLVSEHGYVPNSGQATARNARTCMHSPLYARTRTDPRPPGAATVTPSTLDSLLTVLSHHTHYYMHTPVRDHGRGSRSQG